MAKPPVAAAMRAAAAAASSSQPLLLPRLLASAPPPPPSERRIRTMLSSSSSSRASSASAPRTDPPGFPYHHPPLLSRRTTRPLRAASLSWRGMTVQCAHACASPPKALPAELATVRTVASTAAASSSSPSSALTLEEAAADALRRKQQPKRRFRQKDRADKEPSASAAASAWRRSSSAHDDDRRQRRNSNGDSSSGNGSDGKIRLSKRMSELDLCSRREADRLIASGSVRVRGVAVEPVLGQKIDRDETDIEIVIARGGGGVRAVRERRRGGRGRSNDGHEHRPAQHEENDEENENDDDDDDDDLIVIKPQNFDWDRMRGDTVVLHKPPGYLSGLNHRHKQQHGHDGGYEGGGGLGGPASSEPAVRLLTRENLFVRDGDVEEDTELREMLSKGYHLRFATRFGAVGGGRRRSGEDASAAAFQPARREPTLIDHVPAGRLDAQSSGLLIFTRCGVMAKKLVSPRHLIDKEYVVKVEPARVLSRMEREMGMAALPVPTRDLRPLLRGGRRLWNERRALRPVVEAEWIVEEGEEGKKEMKEEGKGRKGRNNRRGGSYGSGVNSDGGGTLRIVLREGMKRQIRRMCREVLGMHVTELIRTKVGGVCLDDLPVGRWRHLREEEARSIFFAGDRDS